MLTGAAVFGGVCAMIVLVTWHLMRMNRKPSGRRGLVHALVATALATLVYVLLFMIPVLPPSGGTAFVDTSALVRRSATALVGAPLVLAPLMLPIGWWAGRWARRRQLGTQAQVF